jgi:hypothetical protein
MAAVTEGLGFGLTASISFEHPYPFARRMSTLDHLTDGRVGWNVVTSYLKSGAENLGEVDQRNHDNRYDVADEYLHPRPSSRISAISEAATACQGRLRDGRVLWQFGRSSPRPRPGGAPSLGERALDPA